MPKNTFPGFPPETLSFLHDLAQNNNRDWFAVNKPRYEADVLTPALQFIAAMQEPLRKLSPNFLAVPKRMGGSLMRVYRDTRFSKNKLPYKSNIGIQFRHKKGKDVHAPGYYFHIDPDSVFVGVGLWRPDSASLAAIRARIDSKPQDWKKIIAKKTFKERFELAGESLKRAPKGYSPDHSLIQDLRRKDFIAVRNLDHAAVTDKSIVKSVTENFRIADQYMQFLCAATGIKK